MTLNHETRRQSDTDRTRSEWLALGAGALVWALHLSIVYPITSLVCERNLLDLANFTVATLPAIRAIQLVTTVIALVLIAAATVPIWRDWRAMSRRHDARIKTADDSRNTFLTFLTLGLNVVFFTAVIASLIPILVLEPCV